MKPLNNIFCMLLLVLLLTGRFTLSVFAEERPLVREIITSKKDSVFRYTYYFDEYRNKVMENKYYIKDDTAYPLTRTEWIYDANRCVTQREQKWHNGNWNTTYIINSAFTDDFKVLETHVLVTNSIESINKTIAYNYEAGKLKSVVSYKGQQDQHDVIEQVLFNYNEQQSVSSQQITRGQPHQTDTAQIIRYSYNSSGKLDSVILINSIQQVEKYEILTTYYYDKPSGNLTVQIQKRWNDVAAKWENLTRTEFVYDEHNKLVNEVYYHYSSLFWMPNTKYEYKFDSNGLLEEKVMYQPIYRQWRRIYTIEYSDIANGQPNLMESKYNFWGGETGSYANNFIPYYFNEEIAIMHADRMELKYLIDDTTFTTNSLLEPQWLKIYPNPSNGVFYISTQCYYIKSWEVYDLNGVLVKEDNNRYRTGVVDLTALPDGIYIIKAITSDNKQLKQKIVINKKI
ncbi:MAG: T9SS type A sorting domain-containing protein [Paludibacter sp.]|nr:T9SS type A sorting domain-containing protein [Paludibacter sp.]